MADWHEKPTCAGVWIYATGTLFFRFNDDLVNSSPATEHDRCKLWYGPIPAPSDGAHNGQAAETAEQAAHGRDRPDPRAGTDDTRREEAENGGPAVG